MFSKVIECLEQKIQKQIDCKRPSSTKHRFELCESLNPLFFTSSPNNSASKTMKNATK